jgi:hypothetical protein
VTGFRSFQKRASKRDYILQSLNASNLPHLEFAEFYPTPWSLCAFSLSFRITFRASRGRVAQTVWRDWCRTSMGSALLRPAQLFDPPIQAIEDTMVIHPWHAARLVGQQTYYAHIAFCRS